MNEFVQSLSDPANGFAHLSYVLLIASMMMKSMRWLRVLALGSGLAAIAHFTLQTEDYASLTWEILFVIANGTQLVLLLIRSRRHRMRREERELLEGVLRVQEPMQQRFLLDLVEWRDVEPGTQLMRQGQANVPLIYIASGAAAIEHDGRIVGVCGPGDFLGEMSMASGEAASATVKVTNAMRIARFDRDALATLTASVPELERAFDRALNRGLAAKVLRMNAAAAQAAQA